MPCAGSAIQMNASSAGKLGKIDGSESLRPDDDERDELGSQAIDRNKLLIQWFESWRTPMKRWLSSRSTIQPADVDDATQEVFLRLLRYSSNAEVAYPQSYLFRIASNVVNEWRERARNSLPHDEAGLETLQIEPHHEPENSIERAFSDAYIRTAITRLRPRQRQVLELHCMDGLTYKQIAIKLDLSPRIVRRDIAHAYAQLRLELAGER